MKFEKLKPGLVVYDLGRHKMGNTTISTLSLWRVRIVSVDAEQRSCVASWNGNTPKVFYESSVAKWREKEPLLIRGAFGSRRLATREENAAAKAKANE